MNKTNIFKEMCDLNDFEIDTEADIDTEAETDTEIDAFDQISDDKLWDILDNFTNDNTKKDKLDINSFNQTCIQCNSKNLVFTSGRKSNVCNDCGTESQEILDESPEWSNYDDGKTYNNRCGAPSNAFFPKSSLGTTINTPGYSKIKMLRNWGQVPYRERSLAEVLTDIDNKCRKYKITKAVIDNAKILYKNVRETKHDSGNNKGKNVIIRGINRKQIIAACFYFGAILQKSPRSTKEVADIFNLELKQITKGCRKFLEIMKDNFIVFDIKPSHSVDFIERFGTKMKLSKDAINFAKTITSNVTKLDIASDHQSTSLAAASILLASTILNLNISKKTISEIFKISDVTITKTYKKIIPYSKIIIDDNFTDRLYHMINIDKILVPTENLENTEKSEISEKSEKESEKESDTDILIKKLNKNNINHDNIINKEESDSDDNYELDELDESDIVKKDNNMSKKNKLIQIQKEREIRKLEKIRLKEEKIKKKNQLKKSNNSESSDETIVKKRGRPRKNKESKESKESKDNQDSQNGQYKLSDIVSV